MEYSKENKLTGEGMTGNCPICGRHCPLSAPGCGRGRKYAEQMQEGREEGAEIMDEMNRNTEIAGTDSLSEGQYADMDMREDKYIGRGAHSGRHGGSPDAERGDMRHEGRADMERPERGRHHMAGRGFKHGDDVRRADEGGYEGMHGEGADMRREHIMRGRSHGETYDKAPYEEGFSGDEERYPEEYADGRGERRHGRRMDKGAGRRGKIQSLRRERGFRDDFNFTDPEAGDDLGNMFKICTDRIYRKDGRRGGQEKILKLLAHNGEMPQRELQQLLGIQSGSISEILSKLEEKGYIERIKDEEDKRRTTVRLTEAGGSVLSEAHGDRGNQDPFAALDEGEKETLKGLLKKLIDSWKQA